MAKLKVNRFTIFKRMVTFIIESDNSLLFKIKLIIRSPFIIARFKPVITLKKKESSK